MRLALGERSIRTWVSRAVAGVLVGALGVACAPSAPATSSTPQKPAAATTAAPASAAKPAVAPVTIKAVSTWEKNISFSRPLVHLQTVLEQKSGGAMKIDFVGGPEVVPALEGLEAVSRGVFDMLNSSPAFYTGPIPEADAITYEAGEFKKFRAAGALDVYDKVVRERAGVTFVGGGASGPGFIFIAKEEPRSLDFFRGKKIRTVPVYLPVVQALGGAPVTVAPAETYTALERGVADVLGWPENGIEERKIHEVAKFITLPPFWEVRTAFLMNVGAWDRLSAEQQKLLKEAVQEVEDWARADFLKATQEEHERLKKAGVKFVELPPADKQRYQQITSEEGWKALVQKSPQHGKELQDVFQKAAKS